MVIVFLYSRIVGYTESMLQSLVNYNEKIKIEFIYWDKNTQLPYINNEISNVSFIPRSSVNSNDIYKKIVKLKPNLIFVSGWMDKGYLYAITKYKVKNKVKIVSGIDDQWFGTIRQKIGQIISKIYFKRIFDYLWVTGSPQYHYARKMGFENDRIIYNLYSANTSLFNKRFSVNKRILFVGRYSNEKGIENLLDEYHQLPEKIKNEWNLHLIGAGPLKEVIQSKILNYKTEYIKDLGFLAGQELVQEMSKGGVFCLPSFFEPWGVVIHEAAISGFPLIVSKYCGANSQFLIHGFNGFEFNPNEPGAIKKNILKICELNDETLELYSQRSHILGSTINNQMVVSSLMSVLEHD